MNERNSDKASHPIPWFSSLLSAGARVQEDRFDPSLRRSQRWVVLGLALFVLLVSALRFDGPSRGYWDTYISVPAIFMNDIPVDLHKIDGSPRFDYQLAGQIPENTFDPSPTGFGIASKDQRIGAAVLFGAPFSILKMAAFRWGYALTWMFLFLFSFLAMRRLFEGFAIPLFGSLLLVFNPFSLYLDRLNGNLLGLGALVVLFFLLLDRKPHWWLIGLLYGLIGGIRNEAIILAPMLVVFMIAKRGCWPNFFKRFAAFTAAAFVGILPVLLWNRFAYGQMIIHPSQVEHLQGFRPTFLHHFFGSTFQFNGLLNWPFHTDIVRTPHFGYPTALLWPLVTIKVLGVVLAALIPIGLVQVVRKNPLVGWSLVYWFSIVYALFIFQENWEELKQTFMALHLFPMMVFVAAGIHWLTQGARDWARWTIATSFVALVVLFLLAVSNWSVPADERWYVRFPHAATNDSKVDYLPQEERKDWQFFYSHEAPGEADWERRHLSTPSPFPALYRPFHLPDSNILEKIGTEFSQTHLQTLAIWSYIYE